MAAETGASLAQRIAKQVEFYFGDANLPRDKFLLEKVRASPDGWVSLETLMSFARMQKLTTDADAVRAALKDSAAVEVSDDGTSVRRRAPLPEASDAGAAMARTLHVAGLGTDASLDDVEAFLERVCKAASVSAPLAIRLRKEPGTKTFSGAAFVEMASAGDAEALAKHLSESPASFAEGASPVTAQLKAAYFEAKNAEKTAKVSPGAAKAAARRKEVLERMGAGRLLKVRVPAPAEMQPLVLKEALAATFPVSFVDVSPAYGEPGVHTWIRFKEPVAQAFVDKHGADGFALPDGSVISGFDVPAEDEQAAYYDAASSPRRNAPKRRTRSGEPPTKAPRHN